VANKLNWEAVISMPSGVFKPYAGVSTAITIIFYIKRALADGSRNGFYIYWPMERVWTTTKSLGRPGAV